MGKEHYVKFVSGRYWVTVTKTGDHPYKVFQDRYATKVWLVQRGVDSTVAENCLSEANAGGTARVLLLSV
jgi:hypothetical protein